jgi:hypothetical protein
MSTIIYGGLKYTKVRSAVYCKRCKSTVESTYNHDYKMCPCDTVGIDGGPAETRLIGPLTEMEDRSMYCATAADKTHIWLPQSVIEQNFNTQAASSSLVKSTPSSQGSPLLT